MYHPSPRQIAKAERIRSLAAIASEMTDRRADTLPAWAGDVALAPGLEESLFGTAVWPWDPDYDKARATFNAAFPARPRVIVYCEVPGDVQVALALAARMGWKVAPRSGGHSFAGFSVNDGLVLDVSRIHSVTVDPGRSTVVAGAGATWEHIDWVLNAHKLHVPSPGGPSVAVGGMVQGGGYGFTSRRFGMNSDNVLSATVVKVDGQIVTTGPEENSDLFWALRGGTGRNFGVLLDVTYRVRPLGDVWGFRLQWRDAYSVPVLLALQDRFSKTAPPELGYLAGLVFAPNAAAPSVVMMGIYTGTREEGMKVLAPLLELGSPDLVVDHTGSYLVLNQLVLTKPFMIPVNPTDKFIAGSRFVDEPLDAAGWQRLVDHVVAAPNKANFLCVEPYGGAIADVPVSASAYIHRQSYLDVWASAYFADETGREPANQWIDELFQGLGVRAYQNYPNRRDLDYRSLYWGEQVERLVEVKESVNPGNLLQFEQAVSGPGPAGAPRTAPENG